MLPDSLPPWDQDFVHQPVKRITRGPWFALSQSAVGKAAKGDGEGSTDLLLFMHAISRADTFGHAEFESGELFKLLGVNEANVRKAIAKLKSRGLLAPEAGRRGPMGAATAQRRKPDVTKKGQSPATCRACTVKAESDAAPADGAKQSSSLPHCSLGSSLQPRQKHRASPVRLKKTYTTTPTSGPCREYAPTAQFWDGGTEVTMTVEVPDLGDVSGFAGHRVTDAFAEAGWQASVIRVYACDVAEWDRFHGVAD